MGAFVDHPAHDREEQPRDHAVGEHLQHRAAGGPDIGGGETEQHEAHVAHAGVADDELEVVLHQSDETGVEDADDGEPGDARLPEGEADREQRQGDAQAAIGPELHHDAGQQHRGPGGRGDVAGRRPSVKGKHAGEHRKAEEHEGEHRNLLTPGEAGGGSSQVGEAETVRPARRVSPEHAEQHQSAARERVERELHRAVFAAGRAPVRDEEILRHDRDLVEHE